MQNKKLLSIVIITCNRKNELKKTLRSCIDMAVMPIEIIVIDNGSTDGTKNILQSLKDTDDCKFKIYFSETNLGVSGGRNIGFELASSDIVLFIDDDAVFDKSSAKLDTAYMYMVDNKEVGALAFNIYDLKEEGKLLDSFKYNDLEQKEMLSYVGACHMLRKTYDRKYLYPPRLLYGAEERYASILYYNLGLKVEYFPEIKVLHNPSNKTRMSKINTHRNIMINQFVIKRLLLPKKYYIKMDLYFLLRQVKSEKINIPRILLNLKEANKRIKENSEARNIIKQDTIVKISNEYGEFVIL